jgi:type VI secretion system protein ImpA
VNAKKRKPSAAPEPELPPMRFATLATAASPEAPCGEDLEYDPEFVVLQARAQAQGEAQYGDFVAEATNIDWPAVDRDCQRLLARSKDLRALMLFLRARTRLEGAIGMRDVLALVDALIARYPDDIHPRLIIDGEADPALRANALQGLCDPEGFLGDMRELALSEAAATRLSLRDVERALSIPRAPDALSADSVRRQLDELRTAATPVWQALEESAGLIDRIQAWGVSTLGEHAPDMQRVARVLHVCVGAQRISAPPLRGPAPSSGPEDAAPTATDRPDARVADAAAPVTPPCEHEVIGRDSALAAIREARLWFEHHEPSSPVPLLLRRAESLVGRRFDEVFQAIPAELVTQWRADGA